ncbi:hypothetical protein GIB67_012276 [Kingdonia uniflora]|uniref:Uncharacterized protein n=1 Tax=Kingdonia uniflora TaxID=39325 RepID=A0A7J7LG81_9MAGN|nr:hypothetical protein GIB67_012276 [Kingdonia uniflora]
MSIALQRTNISNTMIIKGVSGFLNGNHGVSRISIFESPVSSNFVMEALGRENSCSSSSIGRNSDSSGGDGDGEIEVQSSYKGPLETMDTLSEVLPIRRGISKFYCAKSKSFANLADALYLPSISDIAKPENPYNRKRKDLFCSSNVSDKRKNFLRSNSGGISKRSTNYSRSTLAFAVMSSSDSNTTSDNSRSSSPSSPRPLPPVHPQP